MVWLKVAPQINEGKLLKGLFIEFVCYFLSHGVNVGGATLPEVFWGKFCEKPSDLFMFVGYVMSQKLLNTTS